MTIQWRNGSPGFRRASFRRPGFDCRIECQHEPKGQSQHGWHADELHYVVSNERGAISLSLMTDEFEASNALTREYRSKIITATNREPYDLTVHVPAKTSIPGERRTRTVDGVEYHDDGREYFTCDCDFVETAQCKTIYSSSLGAVEFVRSTPPLDTDGFWQALEQRLVDVLDARLAPAVTP